MMKVIYLFKLLDFIWIVSLLTNHVLNVLVRKRLKLMSFKVNDYVRMVSKPFYVGSNEKPHFKDNVKIGDVGIVTGKPDYDEDVVVEFIRHQGFKTFINEACLEIVSEKEIN